jgi:hypothetical protein
VIETEALEVGEQHPRTGWPFKRRTVISMVEGQSRVFHTGAVDTPAGRTVFVVDPIGGGVWWQSAIGDRRGARAIERELTKHAYAEIVRRGLTKRRKRKRTVKVA